MIKRLVKMKFKPEAVNSFKLVFEKNWQAIKGCEGCLHVELLQDENDPCIFFTYSLWQSETDLNAYRDSDLFARVWGSTKILFDARPEAWTVKELQF